MQCPADGYQFTRSLAWLSPAWIIVFLISPILYVIVYLIVRRRAKITAGLCPRHLEKRRRAIMWGWLIALAGIGSIVAIAVVPENLIAHPSRYRHRSFAGGHDQWRPRLPRTRADTN